MQNLFYVPPHQPQNIHPKPRGVKTVVKRNQPTRLELSTYPYGIAPFDPTADVFATPRAPRLAGLRKSLGALLIRMGRAVTPDETTRLGQPA